MCSQFVQLLGEERSACGPSAIAQLYAVLLHDVVAISDLMVTDTAPKGGYTQAY